VLTGELEEKVLEDACAEDRTVATIVSSASGYGASRWLTTLSDSKCLRMGDTMFQAAVSNLLNVSPLEEKRALCTCNRIATDHHHFFSCRQNAGAIYARHEAIVSVVARFLRLAGLPPLINPAFRSGDHVVKPDLTYILGGSLFFVDVSVTHPLALAASYVEQAERRPGGAARLREREKRRHYEQAAAQARAHVEPLVFESYGRFGRCAKEFATKIAKYAKDFSGQAYGSFLNTFVAEVSVALQTGNALIIEAGRNALRRATGVGD